MESRSLRKRQRPTGDAFRASNDAPVATNIANKRVTVPKNGLAELGPAAEQHKTKAKRLKANLPGNRLVRVVQPAEMKTASVTASAGGSESSSSSTRVEKKKSVTTSDDAELECNEVIDMVDDDEEEVKDDSEPQMVVSTEVALWDNDDEGIWEVMSEKEGRYQPRNDYMTDQGELDFLMRAILFDWMFEVSKEFSLGRESMHLAINYTDRFLQDEAVPRGQLQLVGVTCLFIATKLEEIHPPKTSDFAVTTDGAFSVDDIYAMEQRVLLGLDFKLLSSTPYAWLKLYLKLCCVEVSKRPGLSSREREELTHTLLLVENFTRCMELLDGALHDLNGNLFLPSVLAAAVLLVVSPSLSDTLMRSCRHSLEDLRPAMRFISHFEGLPHYPPLESTRVYVDLKIPEEDMYTRQVHNKSTLAYFRSHRIRSSDSCLKGPDEP